MRRTASATRLALASLAFVISGVVGFASPQSPSADKIDDALSDEPQTLPGAFIIEWSDGFSPEDSFYGDLGLDVERRMDLKFRLFNGGSFRLKNATDDETGDIFQQIATRPEVKAIWPVKTIQMPVPEPSLQRQGAVTSSSSRVTRRQSATGDGYRPHVMAQVDKLRAEGYTGKGIRIAVVDSGIDYTHPALGGCFGEGCLVAYGWDLTGDNYFAGGELEPDADPYDSCVGHGTQVAGIIAAQPNELGFTGAAPDVTLGAYRAWGCSGSTTNDVLLAAFNQAYEDGSDIISCSAGYYTGWSTDPWGIAASRIVEKGVPVIVSAGNSGREGIFNHGSPATGVGVASIGSVDNEVMPLLQARAEFSIANRTEDFGFLSGSTPFTQNLTLSLWSASLDTEAAGDACLPLPDDTPDLSDKLVLLRVSDASACASWEQASNLVAKGAQYLMYYSQDNSTYAPLSFYATGINGVGIVSPSQGAHWLGLLSQGSEITVNIVDPTVADILYDELENYWTGGETSEYTSWGPSWELVSKPQFTAPGANVLAPYPLAMGRRWNIFDGTSASAPLTAAVFALVGQARGTFDPKELSSVISSTSKPLTWFDGETHSQMGPVPQQGAGMVQAHDASVTKTVLSATQLSFNDTDNFVATQSFSIRNTGNVTLVYSLGSRDALTVNTFASGSSSVSRFPPPVAEAAAVLSFSKSEVVVAPGSSADVTVTVSPPRGLDPKQLPVYSGWITLSADNGEGHVLPYIGVLGSMKATPGFLSGPEHGTFIGFTNNPDPANTTYNIARPGTQAPPGQGNYPSILASLKMGSQMVRADVVPLSPTSVPTTTFFNLTSIGMMSGFPDTWVTRRNWRLGIFDGRLADGTAFPEGRFKIVFSALRIFGDAEKAEDWSFGETIPFNIQYLN